MSSTITPMIPSLSVLTQASLSPSKATEISSSFGNIAGQMLNEVNKKQNEADQAVKRLHTGESDSLHDAMLALEEADISMRMLVQVRNKAVDAYQEIMRMQI